MNEDLAQAVKASKAPAIARAAAALRLLGRSEAPLGLNAIARELGLNPSTCLYVLRALAEEELVAFDADTKRYALAAGVLTLARGWLRRDRFAEVAQPALDRLATRFEVTMLGVQIFGLDHIVVIASSQTGRAFQLRAEVGSRFPALISATGRCIAAFGAASEDEIARRFAGLRWDDAPDFAEWRAQVEETRARGFAVDEGHYIAGVTVIAAPVWSNTGEAPGHALVAIGLTSALRKTAEDPLVSALLAGADELSRRLGGAGRGQ
ncbi:MAG: IclR family transcriptional regulator [Sphingomonadales bacterium]|nr:IclR family transcriptional regulator [Sphingomonadales bacterium]